MRASAETGLKLLRGRMQGFLQVGLLDDEELYARELRGVRTQITRVIAELEKDNGPTQVDSGGGVAAGGAGVDSGASGSDAPLAEVT